MCGNTMGLATLAQTGNFDAKLQQNIAEANLILHETEPRRLWRGHAFKLAVERTKRLSGNVDEMKAQVETQFQRQSLAKLERTLLAARENIMAHMSDRSAQEIFILISRFLCIEASLETVRKKDHSAKMKSAGLAFRLGTSAIPIVGGVVGVAGKTGMEAKAQQHSRKAKIGRTPQFTSENTTILKDDEEVRAIAEAAAQKLPWAASASRAAAGAQPKARPALMPARVKPSGSKTQAGPASAPAQAPSKPFGVQTQDRPATAPAQVPTGAKASGFQRIQSLYVRDGNRGFMPINVSAPIKANEQNAAQGEADREKQQTEDTEALYVAEEVSEKEARRTVAVRNYQAQRARLMASMVLKARDKQTRSSFQV